MDLQTLGAQMPGAVPAVGTLRMEFLEVAPQRAMLRLPDRPEYRDHLGGPHPGVLFTLAESAAAAIVLGDFGMQPHGAVPRNLRASIRYDRQAMGPMYAEALMDRTPQSIATDVAAGGCPEFDITVTMAMEDWTVTGEARFTWRVQAGT